MNWNLVALIVAAYFALMFPVAFALGRLLAEVSKAYELIEAGTDPVKHAIGADSSDSR